MSRRRTVVGDVQDNALILDDRFDPKAGTTTFFKLATFVSDA